MNPIREARSEACADHADFDWDPLTPRSRREGRYFDPFDDLPEPSPDQRQDNT